MQLRYFSRTVVGTIVPSLSPVRLRVPVPAERPVASPSVTERVAVPVAEVADCAASVVPAVVRPEVTSAEALVFRPEVASVEPTVVFRPEVTDAVEDAGSELRAVVAA